MNSIRLAKKVESDSVFIDIQQQYEITLPEEICTFLKQNSRGIPTEKTMILDNKEYLLSGFVSVDEKDKNNLLAIARRLKGEEGMAGFIPFATDGFGNYYGIVFKEKQPEFIAYYNAENGNISFVCKEFKEIKQALDLE